MVIIDEVKGVVVIKRTTEFAMEDVGPRDSYVVLHKGLASI
jgi:hypothetical protein